MRRRVVVRRRSFKAEGADRKAAAMAKKAEKLALQALALTKDAARAYRRGERASDQVMPLLKKRGQQTGSGGRFPPWGCGRDARSIVVISADVFGYFRR